MTKRICIIPKVHGVGGMVSFLHKFAAQAERLGVAVTFDLADEPYQAVLVIGGTREVAGLWRQKQGGVRVIQRLDGMNWIQRRKPVSLRHTLRAEYGNWVLAFIRRFVADGVVYQSEFSRRWWNDAHGRMQTPFWVAHNAVDLGVYRPDPHLDDQMYRLLVVEGSLGGGYEGGLENAIHLAEAASQLVSRPLELVVAGEVAPALQADWQRRAGIRLRWVGTVERESIPALMNSAHALFSADVHPACPNSVVEALACGLPVAAYDTGSLAELVPSSAGVIAPYGANAWNLEPPRVEPLALGLAQILQNQADFRAGARAQAEAAFGLEKMAGVYLKALFPGAL